MTDTSRHPEVDVMTAFIDGKLPPDDVAAVAAHLRDCRDCRTIVTETARLERETARRGAMPRWWLAAAAAVVIAVVAIPIIRSRGRSPMSPLIAAAPRDHRLLEPRLSGFPWAPLQAPSRGNGGLADPGQMRLVGAAGEVLQRTTDARTPEALHARGAAYLLSGRAMDAIAALDEAAKSGGDARAWSDLAAARLAAADDHPSQLPEALAAANEALRRDPQLAEAHFNRALILERLGLRDYARAEWQKYLALDPASEWSSDARTHLRALDIHAERFDPKMLGQQSAAELVPRFPEELRRLGEGPLLAAWARDYAAGNHASAAAKLAVVRAIGAMLGQRGEHMLADAVAAIDAAGDGRRAELAQAHELYDGGRFAHSRHDFAVAEAKLRQAAALFERRASPVALTAQSYAAVVSFDQRRSAEAHTALSQLLASVERGRYPALTSLIQGHLAVVANADGDYGTALRWAGAAAAGFRAIGEQRNAAWADNTAAHTLDLIGAADAAWSRRTRLYAGVGSDRGFLGAALHGGAMTLAATGHDAAAASVNDLAVDVFRDDPAHLAAALSTRAQLAARRGDVTAGLTAVAQERTALNKVSDVSLQQTLGAEMDLTDAALRSARDPHAALAALNRSIALFADARWNYLLPLGYLQRAAALTAAGDLAAAAADYRAGLREVEKQRLTIGDDELRLRFFDVGADLADRAVELELARGNVAEAFRIANRARMLGVRASATATIPSHSVVLEYVTLPQTTVIFIVSGDGVRVARSNVGRATLAARIAGFTDKIRRRAPLQDVQAEGAALFRILIAPAQPAVAAASDLVIVPDRELHAVPFAALYDPTQRRYLIEEANVRLAPAAEVAEDRNAPLTPALVVGDPPASDRPQLRGSRMETKTIAAAYGATLLEGADATRMRFIDAASGSALIHYAGHADSDTGETYAALLFTPAADDSGLLGTPEITRLSLKQRPLVVLAACGTFRGSLGHIGGMSSLTRAFLLAGARAVIGTLWEIEDDTAAPLFLRLHDHLRAGAPAAQALRATQVEMIHSSDARSSHPATWAAVEMLTNVQ